MGVADHKRICVTTFAADGTAQASTEWVVALGDTRIGIWLPDAAAWAARLAASSSVVTVQACSVTGTVDRTEPVLEGRAELLADGPVYDEVQAATQAKYGLGASVKGLLDTVKEWGGKTPEGAVVINIVG